MYTALQNNFTSQAFGLSFKMRAQPDKCFSFVNRQGPFESISGNGKPDFIPYSTRCVWILHCLESNFHTAYHPGESAKFICAYRRLRGNLRNKDAGAKAFYYTTHLAFFASSAPTITIIPRRSVWYASVYFHALCQARVLILPHRQGLISPPDLHFNSDPVWGKGELRQRRRMTNVFESDTSNL